ncbi:unnamed protein product [Cuscuta campestris]|uniref:Uncharacterized protein n=1 Tax=Cuscuta campestris TaxID=132261 RepID=A0A484MN93_9ASTE|nr:unnamed protein product [Cuscuta campestris]
MYPLFLHFQIVPLYSSCGTHLYCVNHLQFFIGMYLFGSRSVDMMAAHLCSGIRVVIHHHHFNWIMLDATLRRNWITCDGGI